MQLKKTFSFFHLFLLFLLIVFYGVNNYIWLHLNRYPFVDDEAVHLISATRYMETLSRPGADMFSALAGVDKLYPPFFPFIASLFGLAFGGGAVSIILSNLLFLFGIFVCLYFIGLKMGDARLGLLAALILSLYPMIFQLGRMCMLETALTFTVVAAVTAMIYSDGFKRTKPSALFGLIFGLGVLTKQSYVVLIIGPLLLIAGVSLFKGSWQDRRRVAGNLLLSFVIGAAVASLWYVPNFKTMLPLAIAAATDSALVPYNIPVFSFWSFSFYLRSLVNEQILFFFFVLLLMATPVFFKRKKDEFFFLFLVWIIVTYLIRTFIGNKFLYYTVSCLPAVALVTACGIMNMKKDSLRKIIIWLIFIVGFAQYFLISYIHYGHVSLHMAFHTGTEKDKSRMLDIFLFPGTEILAGVKHFPRGGNFKRLELVNAILKGSRGIMPKIGVFGFDPNLENKKDPGKSVIMTKLDSYAGANFDGLNYYLLSQKISYKIFPLNSDLDMRVNFIVTPIELEKIDSADFKIPIRDFVPVEEFAMPDTSSVYLYRLSKVTPFILNYTPQLSPEYKMSSARIDIHSADMKFAFKDVKSNGVAQVAEWLPEKDWTKSWITQMELVSNMWQQLWIEFVPLESGDMYIQFRGSFYPDNESNHHEVYVDDVAIEGKGLKIVNGSFEEQNYLGSPLTWDLPVASSSQTTELARSGRCSVLIWHDSPLVKKIPVKAGVKYRLSAWFKPYNPVE
ncbi:MAG: glycosyltransferase family 39 protein [Candidatus Omnitrophota bacterium]